MTPRNILTITMLWIAVLSWSVWFGGTIYQMLVITPAWTASPPESLSAFLAASNFSRNITHFFGACWIPVRLGSVLCLLVSGWNLPQHRPLFIASAIILTAGVVFTLVYVYPINAVLFAPSSGNHTDGELRQMLQHWIFIDRIRFCVMTLGYLALLRTLSLPLPPSAS